MSEAFNAETGFKTSEVNRIPVHICLTDKYKTNSIAVYIRQPLKEETATKVAMIPQVLMRGSENHPSAGLIRQALDDLYGATLYTEVIKRGEEQWVVFRMQIANEVYLSDQTPLLEKGIQLLCDVLLRPALENGRFNQKFVEIERDLLLKKFDQIKDDKMRYANKRCVEEMFKDERFGLFAYGEEAQLRNMDAQDLYSYYQQMLQTHPMEWFVTGDVQEDAVKAIISKHFSLTQQEQITIPKTDVPADVEEERIIVEKTKISQGKLHIGCRTGTVYGDADYIALVVCNGVFGGFSHSKLFRNVREKESLAYYVASNIESHKGFMMIYSGIEFKHFEKTVSIIKEQLQLIKDGQISDEELEQTKAVLYNQINESNDQPYQGMERYMHGVISGVHRSPEETLKAIENVTKEDIQNVAQKIHFDTIYFLTTEEEGQHDAAN
ncbi:EF-P 5-aminopentanol modification-associated protein YfmF [Bacillus horti]|uniref:Zn-dependent peptidase n=1 Tax=Caldalkalibacillus horti TaxID=77523 RepID=A0ABT9VUX2_9BACI|nr:pitrilysin family protein [Bacillus horti]MDQ0164787.1 putative Zn-dependent peptidase [Bacillus horti]